MDWVYYLRYSPLKCSNVLARRLWLMIQGAVPETFYRQNVWCIWIFQNLCQIIRYIIFSDTVLCWIFIIFIHSWIQGIDLNYLISFIGYLRYVLQRNIFLIIYKWFYLAEQPTSFYCQLTHVARSADCAKPWGETLDRAYRDEK